MLTILIDVYCFMTNVGVLAEITKMRTVLRIDGKCRQAKRNSERIIGR